jgi:CBS domain-containing protein
MTDKQSELRVKDLVVRDVITVRPDDPLSEAVSLMFENRVTAMPVVDQKGRCRGILSTTDLIGLFRRQATGPVEPDELERFGDAIADASQRGAQFGSRQVAEVMTANVVTVTLEDGIRHAAAEMLSNRVHRLVVTDANRRVIGILSTMDLLEAFARQG